MLTRIRNWWRGEYRPASLESILGNGEVDGHYERPLLARFCSYIGAAIYKNPVPILAAIIGAVVVTILGLLFGRA